MTDPQPAPPKRRFSFAFYVLLGLVASVCVGVFLYREGEAGRVLAAEARRMLEGTESSRGTFYKLDPKTDPAQPPLGKHFHGWKVLSETPLIAPEVKDLRDLLLSGSTYGTQNIRCFQPGMGVRLQTESRELDLLICLDCKKFVTHDGAVVQSWNLSRTGCSRFGSLYKAHVP
jgi:hypothetical protein